MKFLSALAGAAQSSSVFDCFRISGTVRGLKRNNGIRMTEILFLE